MSKHRFKKIGAVFLSSLLVILLGSVPCTASSTIFEDNAQRADSNSPGPNWQEYFMRESEGRVPRQGDTPWCIKGNSLYYSASGQNSYIEDFIQTTGTYPVDNTIIEFDFRGSGSTAAGYVGPIVLWATDAEQRNGYSAVTDGREAIGAGAWYRWENAGTRGVMIYRNGAFTDLSNEVFAGLNQNSFSHHTITIKDNTIIYRSDSSPAVTLPLNSPLPSGEQRHLSLGVRLYDQGQIAEFRNIKISLQSSVTPLPPEQHHNGGNLGTVEDYSQYTLDFLQLVMEQNYDAALEKTSSAFQQENDKASLPYLRDFIDQNGMEGQVVGKSITQTGDRVEVIIYLEYLDNSRISIHLGYSQGKIDSVMGRWGR